MLTQALAKGIWSSNIIWIIEANVIKKVLLVSTFLYYRGYKLAVNVKRK